jgi:hypothetical protein
MRSPPQTDAVSGKRELLYRMRPNDAFSPYYTTDAPHFSFWIPQNVGAYTYYL